MMSAVSSFCLGCDKSIVYCSEESDVIRISHSRTPEECMNRGRELTETEITHSSTIYSQNMPR